MAKRWGELTSPASHTRPAREPPRPSQHRQDPSSQHGRLCRDRLRRPRHRGRPPRFAAPARIIGMRSQGEAEIAIEQGETRYEGVTWTTRRQHASNQLIPLPEPARRGLINLADDVIATTNQAVAAAAQLDPSNVTRSTRSGREAHLGRSAESPSDHPPARSRAQEDHADELDVSHHSCIDGRRIVPFNADLPMYSLASVQGPSHPAGPRQGSRTWLSARRCERPSRWNDQAYQRSCLVALPDAGRRNRAVSLLRLAVNSARPSLVAGVMFGRCESCLDHRSEPISGANDER